MADDEAAPEGGKEHATREGPEQDDSGHGESDEAAPEGGDGRGRSTCY